jgi:hypothetical protein
MLLKVAPIEDATTRRAVIASPRSKDCEEAARIGRVSQFKPWSEREASEQEADDA